MNLRDSSRFALVAAVLVLLPSGVCAQGSAAADATATAERNRGLDLMRQGHPDAAIEAFEHSLSVVESPNTRLDLGRACVAAGRLASGLHELDRARDTARARLDAGQQQYMRTYRAAEAEADAVRPRIPIVAIRFSQTPPPGSEVIVGTTHIPAPALNAPIPVDPGNVQIQLTGPGVREQTVQQHVGEGERPTLVITVEPVGFVRVSVRPSVQRLTVTIDGRALTAHDVGTEYPVTPGHHVIVVAAPGVESQREERDVDAGQHLALEMSLGGGGSSTADARPATASRTPAATASSSAEPAGHGSVLFPAGIVVAIVGVLAVGGGAAAWVVSDQDYQQAVTQCAQGMCGTASHLQLVSQGQTLEPLGIAGMIGGGGVALVGAALAIVGRPRGERPPVAVTASARGVGIAVRF